MGVVIGDQGLVETSGGGATLTVGGTLSVAGSFSPSGAVVAASGMTLTGSSLHSVGAVKNVTANSDAGQYTQIDVTGLYIVPLSGSSVSASAGATPVGANDGQVCLFLNTATKPIKIAGFSDSSYATLLAGTFVQALYYNTSWYHLSGAV